MPSIIYTAASVRTAPTVPPGIALVYPSPDALRQTEMLARHVVWWLCPTALSLAILLPIVGSVATRKGLLFVPPTRKSKIAALCLAAMTGLLSQALFATLIGNGVASGWARLVCLSIGGCATGIVVSGVVMYLCRLRAALYGMFSCIPLCLIYSKLIGGGILGESEARMLMAAAMGVCITMSIRFPLEPLPDIDALVPPESQRSPLRSVVRSEEPWIGNNMDIVATDHNRITNDHTHL